MRSQRKLDTQLLINKSNSPFCENCLSSSKSCTCIKKNTGKTNNNFKQTNEVAPLLSNYSIASNQLISTSTTLNNLFFFDNNLSPSLSTRSSITSTMSSIPSSLAAASEMNLKFSNSQVGSAGVDSDANVRMMSSRPNLSFGKSENSARLG